MQRKRKLSKGLLKAIIVAALVSVITVSLLITNVFVPVKYLFSYTVISNEVAERDTLRVRFLNVGFGDCSVIEFPDGKTMLIDCGDGGYSNQLSVFKTLNKSGIKTIDFLVCTSVKGEHCGGLAEILKYKNVKTVYMPYCKNTSITTEYRAFNQALNKSGATRTFIEFGIGVFNDSYAFCFLSPSAIGLDGGEYDDLNNTPSATSVNNASAVLWLEYNGISFLFLSDCGKETQEKLCLLPVIQLKEGYVFDLSKCNIVKVSNHGDGVSACPMLYDVMTPEAAVISVGTNARSCPSQQVLTDVGNRVGDKLYRTDEFGTVTVTVRNGGYRIN